MEKLKPCPFCGADDWFFDGISFWCLEHHEGCHLYVDGNPEMILNNDKGQIGAWNRRTADKGAK
jgi:hypothetical protein